MKKIMMAMLTTLLVATALTGCSMFEKANGVILYGEEQEIKTAVDKEKKKDKFSEEVSYKIKLVENDAQRIMILSNETAQALIEKKLIRKVTKDSETELVKDLSKVDKGEGILFAKRDSKQELNVDGVNINIKYEGNLLIGKGRSYVDMFLIVHDEEWASVTGTEKVMAILKYTNDPSKKGLDYDVETTQLITIGG